MTQIGGIRLDRARPVPVIMVDRPETANALSLVALDGIERALDELEADATCRCVVVTGGGERAFSAGGPNA